MINGECTFDSFVVDMYNRNAYETAKEFVKKKMVRGLTLGIFGLEGTGKTSLLHAIANYYIKESQEEMMYVPGDELFQELDKAIRRKDMFILALKWKYRKADVICLDNIRELLADDRIQPWFLHWLHHCNRKYKRIIYTQDCDERMYCVIQKLSDLNSNSIVVGIPKTGQNRNLDVIRMLE